jgi:dTMP kinase
MPGRGRLVVFEGVEGVGKTTQIRLLGEWLVAHDVPAFTIREPGGTPVGDEIRRLLLDSPSPVSDRAEALLFMASRAQVVADEIVPRLTRGEVVLADRFFLSTYAYQCGGRGLPDSMVREANRLATADLVPDLTVLLDLPVKDGLARVEQRGVRDRIERAADGFHERVASAFLRFRDPKWQAAHPECGPVVIVSASGDPAAVHRRILTVLAERLPETFSSTAGSHRNHPALPRKS